jgi:hypothetical protein
MADCPGAGWNWMPCLNLLGRSLLRMESCNFVQMEGQWLVMITAFQDLLCANRSGGEGCGEPARDSVLSHFVDWRNVSGNCFSTANTGYIFQCRNLEDSASQRMNKSKFQWM